MSRTTFQIGSILASTYPDKAVEHLGNFVVEGADTVETSIAGVMVRYRVSDQIISWCYI
jgi:hypothetical protein